MVTKLSMRRFLGSIAFVILAFVLARLGRWLLDDLIAAMPQSAAVIERIGGWVIGVICTVVVVIPLFRLYGILGRPRE